MTCCRDNQYGPMTFQGLGLEATKIALWAKSQWGHWVFDYAEAIWLVKIGYLAG